MSTEGSILNGDLRLTPSIQHNESLHRDGDAVVPVHERQRAAIRRRDDHAPARHRLLRHAAQPSPRVGSTTAVAYG